jgi:hypothetical protein
MDAAGRRALTVDRSGQFVATPASQRLLRMIQSGVGDPIGLSGVRGSGKTATMKHACNWAETRGGLGVWFPSPSEYEPTAFVASLCEVVANSYLRRYRRDTSPILQAATRHWPSILMLSFFGLFAPLLIVIVWSNSPPKTWWIGVGLTVAFWAFILASVGALATAILGRRASRVATGQSTSAANDLRQLVRYSISLRNSREVAGRGGPSRINATWRYKRDMELTERPVALASFTTAFRAFAESLPRVVNGPLVLAIDELDKLESNDRAAQLLRDVKGVFDIDGVHILVSVSDEAARQFELGSVKQRNEFNSTFPRSVQLSGLGVSESLQVLGGRGIHFSDEGVVKLLNSFEDGIAREVIRKSESIYDALSSEAEPLDALAMALQQELAAFLEESSSLTTVRASGSRGEVQLGVYRVLQEAIVSIGGVSVLGDRLYELWAPSWGRSSWSNQHGEAWKRLLIRTALVGVVNELQCEGKTRWCSPMQSIVHAASISAHAGIQSLTEALLELVYPEISASLQSSYAVHFVDEVVLGTCSSESIHEDLVNVGLFDESGAATGPVSFVKALGQGRSGSLGRRT